VKAADFLYTQLTSKKRHLLGGKYQPLVRKCMKKILNVIMALLTGALSISVLGLFTYGVEAAVGKGFPALN
jgi:hypothetical protein